MSAEELVRHDLATPGVDLPDHFTRVLDLDPPSGLLPAVAERTGVPLFQLRHMTISGWVPWLLDTLGPEPESGAAFDTYVHQDSALLRVDERRRRLVPNWRAWLPSGPTWVPMWRACPTCLTAAPATDYMFSLVSQLPFTLSCPTHGCRLEPTFGLPGTFHSWESPSLVPTIAPAAVAAMDRRTHEGLGTGAVSLPGRSVHVGAWFRLLRTVLDELSTPLSALRTESRRSIRSVWQMVGHPIRAGMGLWCPYEALAWHRQQVMLEAAATALYLIETGEINARGTLAPLLALEPDVPVPGGTPPPRNHWQDAMDAAAEALALAQRDRNAARQLLTTLTAFTRTEKSFQRIRDDLLFAGVPDDYLPGTLAEKTASATRGRASSYR